MKYSGGKWGWGVRSPLAGFRHGIGARVRSERWGHTKQVRRNSAKKGFRKCIYSEKTGECNTSSNLLPPSRQSCVHQPTRERYQGSAATGHHPPGINNKHTALFEKNNSHRGTPCEEENKPNLSARYNRTKPTAKKLRDYPINIRFGGGRGAVRDDDNKHKKADLEQHTRGLNIELTRHATTTVGSLSPTADPPRPPAPEGGASGTTRLLPASSAPPPPPPESVTPLDFLSRIRAPPEVTRGGGVSSGSKGGKSGAGGS